VLIGNLPPTATFVTEIPQAGRVKQVWSSLSIESMRVKPVGRENLDKLESAPDDPPRTGSAQQRVSQQASSRQAGKQQETRRGRTTTTPDIMITQIVALSPDVEARLKSWPRPKASTS
jgi:hypothetical protein